VPHRFSITQTIISYATDYVVIPARPSVRLGAREPPVNFVTRQGILAFGSNAMTRSQLIAFRLTPEEYAGLAAAARAGRLAPAAWCRRAVLEQFPPKARRLAR